MMKKSKVIFLGILALASACKQIDRDCDLPKPDPDTEVPNAATFYL